MPADRPQTLFSLLSEENGWESAVFLPRLSVAPPDQYGRGEGQTLRQQTALVVDILWRAYLFDLAPEEYRKSLPTTPLLWFEHHDTTEVNAAQRRGVFHYALRERRHLPFEHLLRCLDPDPGSVLYFAHLLLPHITWNHLPSARQYQNDLDSIDLLSFHADAKMIDCWGDDEHLVVQGQQRYLLQLQYVDRLVGELIRRLKEVDLFDRCLLIATADHGVSFRPGQPRRRAVAGNLADILSVPLFVKRPFQESGGISDQPVESVDILPTVADVLGIELELPTDGWSIFDTSRPLRRQTTFCQGVEKTFVEADLVARSDVPATIRRRFGDPQDPDAIFRIGPAPELIGRSVDEFERSATPRVELTFLRYGDVLDESPDAIVPCFFEGHVTSSTSESGSLVLAVAINGTIRAVTRTYRVDGFFDRWSAMVPESCLRMGKNDVQFFAVSGSGPQRRLSPCTTSRATERQR
jgi:hypothetical protein